MSDIAYLEQLAQTIKSTSRCGLGQTSPNPVVSTIKNFPECYEAALKKETNGMQPAFNLKEAVKEAEDIIGRSSIYISSS